MRNKLILIGMFALFFAPIVAAVLLHSRWVDWQAAPEKAHGELIQPVVPLGPFEFTDARGEPIALSDLTGRWQLLHARSGDCGSRCLETLELMHNVRLAQDRHRDEVGLLLLSGNELADGTVRQLDALDPAWQLVDGQAARTLMQRLPDFEDGAFYILDPEANIMERFAPGDDLNGMRKDLDRLLTWTVREQ